MTPPHPQPEHRLLIACLSGLWEPAALEGARELAHGPIDWDAFSRAVYREYLAPLLYHLVRDRQIVPAAVEDGLRNAYYALAAHNSVLLHELEGVLRALDENGVTPLLLKGAAFLYSIYPSIGVRPMVDVDLLVPAAQIAAAQAALTGLGYSALVDDPWPGFTLRYRGLIEYTRPSGGELPFAVGLHRYVYDVQLYQRIPLDGWLSRAVPLPDAGPGARMPSAEDHLVYLCGHIALHHQYAAGMQRALDLALLIRRSGAHLDWEGIAKRAGNWRLVMPVQRSLAGLERLWPGTVPPEAAARIAGLRPTPIERRVHAWVTEQPRTPASDTLLALATLPGIGRRLRVLAEVAVPSPAFMRRRFCPEHPRRWPLAYFSRAWMAVRAVVRRRGGKAAE